MFKSELPQSAMTKIDMLGGVYKKEFDGKRQNIVYPARGHPDTTLKQCAKGILIRNCATRPKVISSSYTYEEIEKLCDDIIQVYQTNYDIKYLIDSDTNEYLYLCFIHKTLRKSELHSSDIIT